MKTLFAIVLSAFAITAFAQDAKKDAPAEAPKTKQVCMDVVGKDGKPVILKDGKTQQNCRTIKIHKKFEGTEIPPKK
jgi:hypothetical protein